jgi:hypothetical protein
VLSAITDVDRSFYDVSIVRLTTKGEDGILYRFALFNKTFSKVAYVVVSL